MLTLPILFWAAVLAAQTPSASSPADIAAGAQTFRSHCAACHGYDATGGRGPNLTNGVFYHGGSDEDLVRTIGNGIPGTEMPGLFYSRDRIRQIVAYLRSLNVTDSKPAGDSRRGAALFRSAGCAACHRISGEGARLGPDLTEIGRSRSAGHLRRSLLEPSADVPQRYQMVSFKDSSGATRQGFLLNEDTYSVQFLDARQELLSFDKGGLTEYRVEKVSRMPSYRGKLDDSQIDDLVAYLASLRPKGGAR